MEEKGIVKKEPQGLTLMELIQCMAIVAALMAVVSPLIIELSSGYNLRAAARELATDLQFARLLAVKENKNFQVVCDGNSYRVSRVSDGFVAKARNFSADYPEVSLNAPVVTFNSGGNSSVQSITVSDLTGTKNITVGSNGRVKLQ